MAFPINATNGGLIQDKINSNNNTKNKVINKSVSTSNTDTITNTTSSVSDTENKNVQNSGVSLEISSESKTKSDELQNKKLIDNSDSANEILNSIKQHTRNLTKAQAHSTPENVLSLLA